MAGGRRIHEIITDTVKVAESGGVSVGEFVMADGTYPAAGAKAHGITMSSGAEGDYVEVMQVGIIGVRITTASGVATDDVLMASGTSGGATKLVEATGANAHLALALEVPSSDGDLIDSFVNTVETVTGIQKS